MPWPIMVMQGGDGDAAIEIPDPLPPTITPPRTVIEFLIDQDLGEYGETGLIARTWHWVLHG
jgi:hypothetical protein